MAIIIDNSNHINSEYDRRGISSSQTESVRGGSYRADQGASGLSAGTTVTGEIVEKDGDRVTINIGQNQTVSARLQGNADIEVGMKMTFEVAKGSNDQISLRPLYSNLTNNNAAISALRAAGLPINSTTLAMTDKMMTESMPVNRNALSDMFRNVSAHSNVSPESIVQMTKLNMPLTESNVIQFDNYRNFEHRITSDLQNVSEGIGDLLKEAADSITGIQGNESQAFGNLSAGQVISEVLNLIDTDSLETIRPAQTESDVTSETAVTGQTGEPAAEAASGTADTAVNASGQNVADIAAQTPNTASSIRDTVEGMISGLREMFTADADAATVEINVNLSLTAAEQMTLAGDLQDILILAGQSADIHEPLDPSQVITSVKELIEEYPPDDIKVIETELPAYSEQSQEGLSEETLNSTARSDIAALTADDANAQDSASRPVSDSTGAESTTGTAPTATQPDELAQQSVKAKIHEKLNELLKSDGFSKLVKDSVKAQMSIKPEQVAEKGKIDELYDKIQKTTARINEMMESIGRTDSAVAKSAGALSDNVNFMNQLNEFVNYVQLPLKMAGEDANGELYVYTNKKNLSNPDGNYSALLHLDMDHLGPMDIYVTMRDHTKVSTNFYLQTEELLDFIGSHIDELTKRLTDKGYNTTTKVTKKQPGEAIKPITDEFTKDEANVETPVVVSRMRFDVRA